MLPLLLCLSAQAHESEPGLKPYVVPPTEAAQLRKRLRWAGIAGMASAGLWYFAAGDSLGAGDPATLLAGAGLVATTGALIGGSYAVLDPREPAMGWEASGPPLRLTLSPGGSTTIGENVPYGGSLELAPRFILGPELQLIAQGTLRGDFGDRVDVDPRPQSDFAPALSRWGWGADVNPELRWYREGMDFRLRPTLLTRYTATTFADGSTRQLERQAWMPLTLGVRFYVSGRQRFGLYLGPRWDSLRWSDGGQWQEREVDFGPIYGQAFYSINRPHMRLPGGLVGASRLRISYEHSNFDGQAFDFGAVVGFFGPVTAQYDMQLRRPGWDNGVQVGLGVSGTKGGQVNLSIGWNTQPFGAVH